MCYGEIRKAHKQKWLFAVMAIYNILITFLWPCFTMQFHDSSLHGDLAVTTIFVKTTYVPLVATTVKLKVGVPVPNFVWYSIDA